MKNDERTIRFGSRLREIQAMLELICAKSQGEMGSIRILFNEYQSSLGLDLSFQGFVEELKGLPGRYAPPDGSLILASVDGQPAGCIALREIAPGICEMKRMYVRPEFRRRGIGQALTGAIIEDARKTGYTHMRLDTIDTMIDALTLYRSLGFHEIPAYYHNPNPGTVYMELAL